MFEETEGKIWGGGRKCQALGGPGQFLRHKHERNRKQISPSFQCDSKANSFFKYIFSPFISRVSVLDSSSIANFYLASIAGSSSFFFARETIVFPHLLRKSSKILGSSLQGGLMFQKTTFPHYFNRSQATITSSIALMCVITKAGGPSTSLLSFLSLCSTPTHLNFTIYFSFSFTTRKRR